MQGIGESNYSYNDFNCSIATSSGDKINLDIYDEKSSSYFYTKNSNKTSIDISLEHSYGYSFDYSGDGIDAQDKKEIDEALNIIKPMLSKFLKNVNRSNKMIGNADITNAAFEINSKLPKIKDKNTQNYVNAKRLNMMDKILSKIDDKNKNLLKNTQKLFDEMLYQMDGFKLYV